jgi:hypothetical protein
MREVDGEMVKADAKLINVLLLRPRLGHDPALTWSWPVAVP